MKKRVLTSASVMWQKRRLFFFSVIGVAIVIALDLLTILSFDSLPQDIFALTESEGIYRVFEEWYSYIGLFFIACFYLILLGCMCVVFLLSAWEGKVQLIPALLIWHSSLGILSAIGKIGKLLSATHPNMFSEVAEGLGELSFLPLLLCLVYFMEKYHGWFIPFVLADCFCSATLLFALVWKGDDALIYVAQTLSDAVFLVCVFVSILFSLLEIRAKNSSFKSFLPLVFFSLFIVAVYIVFSVLIKNGFSMTRVQAYISSFTLSLSWIRSKILDPMVFISTGLLIIVNSLSRYHRHTLELQSMKMRDEANLEYARSLQKYETKVREIKHDMANTLNVAAMLCKNGEYEQLGDYLGTMTDHIASVSTGQYCTHILANYLLLMFEERFTKIGAEFRCKAALPAELDIPDTELARELNNILQNALDAVQKLPEEKRWVEITVRMEKSVVRIDCRNPYEGEPIVSEDGLFHTSKSDRTRHGLGMSIIYEVAEKHGGVVVPLFGNGIFEIKVAIPVGKDL